MDAEGLSIICAGIGYADEDENGAIIGYTKGEYCLDNLKDLQRFLRRDDPRQRDVFKQICKWNTVSRNLVPLIEYYQSDRNLVINAVKILVFLTMPIDPSSDGIAQQIEYLWDLKSALTRPVTIAVTVCLLEDPLDHLECKTFTEDDWKLVQLVLTLFRNVLAIQDITLQQKSSGSSTQFFCLTDRFLELMFQEYVLDLILVLTQHVDGCSGSLQQDNLLLLETFYYIFLGREPELIAKVSKRSSKVNEDITTTVDSLRTIMDKEEEKRRIIRLRNLERHSQFSGTFTRFGVDGSKTLFKRNPTSASGNGIVKVHNVQRGPLKRIAWDHDNLPPAKENILELLYEFLNQFLSGGYNVLMQSIHDDISKECQSIQKTDVMMFFGVAKFVLAFQHQKILISKEPNMEEPISDPSHENEFVNNLSFDGNICGPVAAIINEAMFNLVISKWLEAFDSLKETKDYKSLSAAGSSFKNMIRMLDLVLKVLPEDSKETQTACVLLYKLFYDQTDKGLTHFLLNMFRSFNTHKQPKSDLADLLEIMHVVLRLMEKLQARGTLRVARKSRKGRKKKTYTEANNLGEHVNPKHIVAQTEETGGHSNNLSKEQLRELSLVDKLGDNREGTFMSNDAAVPDASVHNIKHSGEDMVALGGDVVNTNFIEPVHEPTDSSSDDQLPETNEVDFNISKLVATFANNYVVYNLCWLLKYYKSNSVSTNHHIITMLRRICDDLDISPVLYQLSILRVFYNILADQKSSASKEYASIVNFLTKFTRKMLKLLKDKPLLFVEILFWKTRKECHCISADVLLSGLAKRDLHNDEVVLTHDIGYKQKSLADSLGDDEFMIPYDLNNQRDENPFDVFHEDDLYKTKQHVSEKNVMRSISNDDDEMDVSKGTSSRFQRTKDFKWQKSHIFDQKQETMIKHLYDKYKDDKKCSRLIAEALDPEGKITAVQIYRKLRQLGLQTTRSKKLACADVPLPARDDPTEEAGIAFTITPEGHEDSYLKTSVRRRKRVQTFSKDQELEIKILFERFNDHKNCSHMIAKALDADNTYTAAQVSWKLKQLGLLAPKKLTSPEIKKHSRDDENKEKGLQLEETLFAIKKSHKKRKSLTKENESSSPPQNIELPVEDDSGVLRTTSKNRRKRRNKSPVKEGTREIVSWHEATSAEHDSDEEVLATLFKMERDLDQQPADHETDGVGLDEDVLDAEQQSHEDEIGATTATFTAGFPALDDNMEDEMDEPSKGDGSTEAELMDYFDSEGETNAKPPSRIGHKRNLKLIMDEDE
ncbi:hypothetical protein OPV22_010094 [Ensete ventricosum]|uniref:Timeless N-terminal domain-containing protein n=1 Tax=Ensete ventricosum TaxID=4639 RepID=A0AAV8RG19_ENSVE|nr:hypothetical protein OPV22_010094 [Ensete ventricosum]